ncbi:MAG: hypothetical protein AB2L26_05950 [Ignavibacteria bacterium]
MPSREPVWVRYIPGNIDGFYLMVSNSTSTVSYKSTDDGATWEIIAVPSQIKDINDLAIYYSGTGGTPARSRVRVLLLR